MPACESKLVCRSSRKSTVAKTVLIGRVHNPKFFSSYNIPKVTAGTIPQVLISDRTVTFSESSSLRGKRACNILRKCPPTQKIGITCFLSCAVRKWVFSANFCVLSEKERDEKGDNTPFLYTLLSKCFCLHKLPPSTEWMIYTRCE